MVAVRLALGDFANVGQLRELRGCVCLLHGNSFLGLRHIEINWKLFNSKTLISVQGLFCLTGFATPPFSTLELVRQSHIFVRDEDQVTTVRANQQWQKYYFLCSSV